MEERPMLSPQAHPHPHLQSEAPPQHSTEQSTGEEDESQAGQARAWQELRRAIGAALDEVKSARDVKDVCIQLLRLNLVRGRGVFVRCVIDAANAASIRQQRWQEQNQNKPNERPERKRSHRQIGFPPRIAMFAAVVCVVNAKIPPIGELLVCRLVRELRAALTRRHKQSATAACRFLAHLTNQHVCSELLALETLSLLLEDYSNMSVEVAVQFMLECGMHLMENAKSSALLVFDRFRFLLQEHKLGRFAEGQVEVLMNAFRKDFSAYPSIAQELDVLSDDEKITHEIGLENNELDMDAEAANPKLDAFRFDEQYSQHENTYKEAARSILGAAFDDVPKAAAQVPSELDQNEAEQSTKHVAESNLAPTRDMTDAEVMTFRKSVYLTIMSALSAEEAAHKLFNLIGRNPGQEPQLCSMIVESCTQERAYIDIYATLAIRFCHLQPSTYTMLYEDLFALKYAMVHQLETGKIRNLSKFFAALLEQRALPWSILELITLTQEDTTSSSRIFLKFLFQQLAESLGVQNLRAILLDEALTEPMAGLLPMQSDDIHRLRFSINFFTSIGLGALTDEMRARFKYLQELSLKQRQTARNATADSEDESEEDDVDVENHSGLRSHDLKESKVAGQSSRPKGDLERSHHRRNGKHGRSEGLQPQDRSMEPQRIHERHASKHKHRPSRRRKRSESESESSSSSSTCSDSSESSSSCSTCSSSSSSSYDQKDYRLSKRHKRARARNHDDTSTSSSEFDSLPSGTFSKRQKKSKARKLSLRKTEPRVKSKSKPKPRRSPGSGRTKKRSGSDDRARQERKNRSRKRERRRA
ncbi:Pre-mRNA-splicing factor CWC22-like [Porphyridium purpureum]|uniref:Pre-mRNA-splicing factor CWC22-like n=1 Tax=Porphyridium purpureum TaxID=35688 RepID=A0A5J4YR11_PORPP|nr:Pre-mRNA-splicing factor CWC22-like [Porphyridium purpureum]|eukprot:POR4691..scf229_5